MKRLLIIILFLFLCGCQSIPISGPVVCPVVKTRIFDSKGQLIVENEGGGDIQIAEGWSKFRIDSEGCANFLEVWYKLDTDELVVENESGIISKIKVNGKITKDILDFITK